MSHEQSPGVSDTTLQYQIDRSIHGPSTKPETKPSKAKTWLSRLAMVGALVGGGFAVEAGTDALAGMAAGKPSCYGDYCTGKYAAKTGCDKDARTLLSAAIYQKVEEVVPSTTDVGTVQSHKVKVGTLELRGSKECGTVWSRATIHEPSYAQWVSVKQSQTGHTQTRELQPNVVGHVDEAVGVFISPQLYTHNYASQAIVRGNNVAAYTTWAPGLRAS